MCAYSYMYVYTVYCTKCQMIIDLADCWIQYLAFINILKSVFFHLIVNKIIHNYMRDFGSDSENNSQSN